MKHLYFIRHGMSEMNKVSQWSGARSETPLTPEGRAQATAAGIEAKALYIDYIMSSPLGRAHDTARIIAQEIGYPEANIELNSLLIERDFGPLEGTPWDPDLNVDGIVDVETTESVLNRARLVFAHARTLDADVILLASHGSMGRALRHLINPDIPFEPSSTGHRFPNGKIIKLL